MARRKKEEKNYIQKLGKTNKSQKTKDIDNDKFFAWLATFLTVVGFLIAILAKKKSEYVQFYAKQGIMVFIALVIVGIVGWAVGWIPVLGWIIYTGLSILLLVVWLVSWINALSGKMKNTLLISDIANKISL